MGYKRIVEPDDEDLLPLEKVKSQCRVTHSEEDEKLEELRQAAREFCEDYAGRSFGEQTWRRTLDRFPCKREIWLRYPPLISVSSITYIDSDGTEQTLSPSSYFVDTESYRGRIALAPNASWPATQACRANAVTIEYVAGYDGAPPVPMRAKQAMLMLITHHYDRRTPIVIGTITSELQLTLPALLDTIKVYDRDED